MTAHTSRVSSRCVTLIQSFGENLDGFGLPLNEAKGMYYLVVPTTEWSKIKRLGLHPIHSREYLFVDEEDALAHAYYLVKHWEHPVSLLGVDRDVRTWHTKNALYMKPEKKPVHVVAVGVVPRDKIHHLKDISGTEENFDETTQHEIEEALASFR